MSSFLVFAFSLSLWIPGVGIPVGAAHGVQSSEVLAITVALWLFAGRFHDRFDRTAILALLTIFTMAANWLLISLLETTSEQSLPILAYYFVIVLPTLLCGVLIFTDDRLTTVFVRGALAGAAFTSVMCILQMVLPAELTDLRNNLSFRLPPQRNRSFGMFPEASIAAGMLTFPIAVAVAGLLSRAVREQFIDFGWWRGRSGTLALLVLLLLALLSTRSTSVMFMLPLMAFAAFTRFFNGTSRRKITYAVSVGALLTLGCATYYSEIYSVRLENGAAVYSAAERLVSVLAAFAMLKDSHFWGAGLGANNNLGTYVARVADDLAVQLPGDVSGVHSFVVGRCLEEGLVMIVVFTVVLFRIARAVRRKSSVSGGVAALLGLNTLLNAVWVAGYRGLLMYWLLIPLAFVLEDRIAGGSAPINRAPTGTLRSRIPAS